jgi:Na+-translocating ferredoxin:NAD+ oxidoreductase subunit D
MSQQQPSLLLTTSPFLKQRQDTMWIMWQVNLALVPVVLMAAYFYGIGVFLVIVAASAGALLPEYLVNKGRRNTIRDGSAIITGTLLALTLPPSIPLWMAFVGGASAIILGKLIFGGIGYNIFNPALVGRAFLQAAFPSAMTTWSLPGDASTFFRLHGDAFAPPLMQPRVDAVSEASPLASMKFDGITTDTADLLFGSTAGSIGETSAIVILLAGAYLVARGVMNWRIPVSVFATVYVLAAVLKLVDPSQPEPIFHLLSGGLVLGAIFMATDPVTSPITQRGVVVFGIGIGVLVIVIRVWGGLPEGVMFAILLMNAAVPIINRFTSARVFGRKRADRWKP